MNSVSENSLEIHVQKCTHWNKNMIMLMVLFRQLKALGCVSERV